jgi:hypothetical protein
MSNTRNQPNRANRESHKIRTKASPRKHTLPKEPPKGTGGARRDRTDDLKLAKLALSQLSYGPFELNSATTQKAARAIPIKPIPISMVGLGRLERPTSPLSGVRSNHLSYRPVASPRESVSATPDHALSGGKRETKTAAFRQMRPDWPLLFQEIR